MASIWPARGRPERIIIAIAGTFYEIPRVFFEARRIVRLPDGSHWQLHRNPDQAPTFVKRYFWWEGRSDVLPAQPVELKVSGQHPRQVFPLQVPTCAEAAKLAATQGARAELKFADALGTQAQMVDQFTGSHGVFTARLEEWPAHITLLYDESNVLASLEITAM